MDITSREGHNGGDPPGFQRADPEEDERVRRHRERYARLAEERISLVEESERARFRFGILIVALCWTGTVIGLLPMGWALHTTDVEAAQVAWALGPPLGICLNLAVLAWGYVRWEREDW